VTIPVLRPARLEDAELAADLMTACYPPEPRDPVVHRYRWEHPPADWSFGRFIAELDGTPIAYVAWSHLPWEKIPERYCEIDVWLDRARLDPDLLSWLVQWVSERATDEGARVLSAGGAEDEPMYLAALERFGFERDRADKVWELDLEKHGKRLLAEAAAARVRTEESGITMTTFEKWSDPDKSRKLHALHELTSQDEPHTLPIVPETLETYMARMSAPDRLPDRMWIALDANRVVAISYLRFPPVRGAIWTGFTGCDPEYRGRGIARAVKLQSLAHAVELGVSHVRTANDTQNAPMLHINETLGYTLRPGFVGYLKRVES
jgi:GNAT superfamily N-acetyltransferase